MSHEKYKNVESLIQVNLKKPQGRFLGPFAVASLSSTKASLIVEIK